MELVVGLAVHWLFVTIKPEQHGEHRQPGQVVLHPMVRGNADTQQHLTHDPEIIAPTVEDCVTLPRR